VGQNQPDSKIVRPNYIVLIVLVLIGACRSSRSALEPVQREIPGMDSAAAVGDLLIGGQPNDESLEELARRGYRSVLTVRGEGEVDWDEQSRVEAHGLSFHRIDMSNPVNEITDDQVAAFARFMEERDGPALVHCSSGNRAAGLWAVWLIEHQGVEFEDAIRYAKAAGMRDSIGEVVERRVGDVKTLRR
jgi:uncharacterized protein (TIGR01244 family)